MPQYRVSFLTICSTRMGCLKNAFSGLLRFARLKTHKQLRRRQSEHLSGSRTSLIGNTTRAHNSVLLTQPSPDISLSLSEVLHISFDRICLDHLRRHARYRDRTFKPLCEIVFGDVRLAQPLSRVVEEQWLAGVFSIMLAERSVHPGIPALRDGSSGSSD